MNIIFPVELYQKLLSYVDNTEYEISGFGKIAPIGQDFFVDDIKIFDQTVSKTTTILKGRDLGKFFDQTIQQEGTLKGWKMWWHSHADMETFWSATDVATIEDFDSETEEDNWMISLETNHVHDLLARLDIFSPLRLTIPLHVVVLYNDPVIEAMALDEMEVKVKADVQQSVLTKKQVDEVLDRFRGNNKFYDPNLIPGAEDYEV